MRAFVKRNQNLLRRLASGLTSHGAAAMIAALLASVAQAAPVRVLFVGNSFTYGHANPIASFNHEAVTDLNGTKFGGIPGIFKQLTVQAKLDYDVAIEAVGGQTLAYHVLKKADVLSGGDYDDIVLQGFSMEPLPKRRGGNPQNFYAGAAELTKLLRAKHPHAQLWFYETWASPTGMQWAKYLPGMAGLMAMTNDLARGSFKVFYDDHLDGIIRVGEGFQKAIEDKIARVDPAAPESEGVDIWYKDHRHPSIYGSYLSAVMFYAKLTKHDPRELGTGDGSAAAALKISPQIAASLHRIAYEINAAAEPAVSEVTTRLPIKKVARDGKAVIRSISTAEGDSLPGIQEVAPVDHVAQINTPHLAEQLGPFTQQERFAILTSAEVKEPSTVTLVDANGAAVGTYRLILTAADFGTVETDERRSGKYYGASFSLSDLGVADLSTIRNATGLRLEGDGLKGAGVALFGIPVPGDDSIFVIGSGPPKIPPAPPKKKGAAPATAPE